MPEFEYSIINNWDNAAGLVNVESINPGVGSTIPNHTAYFVVKAYNAYRRGQRRFSPNVGSSFAGFKSVIWNLLDVDAASYEWLVTNRSGQVTIRTTTGVDGVYSNWNAYAIYPDPADLEENDVGRYGSVDVLMILVEAL